MQSVLYERSDGSAFGFTAWGVVCSEGWAVHNHGHGSFVYDEAGARFIVGGELLQERWGRAFAAVYPNEIFAWGSEERLDLPPARCLEIAERIIRAYGHFGQKVVGPDA